MTKDSIIISLLSAKYSSGTRKLNSILRLSQKHYAHKKSVRKGAKQNFSLVSIPAFQIPHFICSKITIEIPERRQCQSMISTKLLRNFIEITLRHWRCSGLFIVNLEPVLHIFIVDFEQVNLSWDSFLLKCRLVLKNL